MYHLRITTIEICLQPLDDAVVAPVFLVFVGEVVVGRV